MNKKIFLIILLVASALCLEHIQAQQTFTSVASGNWSNPATWGEATLVPGAQDLVIIVKGHNIDIDNSTLIDGDPLVPVDSIVIQNVEGVSGSISTLTVTNNILEVSKGIKLIGKSDKNAGLLVVGSVGEMGIGGDIVLEAPAADKVSFKVDGGAVLTLKGNLIRPNGFGSFIMDSSTELVLAGADPQTIPAENGTGETVSIGDLEVSNPNGIVLTDTLYVEGDLTLTNGNIVSSDQNPVIVSENATITGGSANGYIEGPVTKVGRTNGDYFVFPIGNETRYAPFAISKVIKSTSSYTARYEGDPPPFGAFESTVEDVDPTQYWKMTRGADSEDVSIQLTWSSGAASKLTHLDSVIVVGLVGEGTPGAMWMNYGQANVSGGIGAAESGTVQSLEGDPPPFGVVKFTVGTGVTSSSLPVELINFKVKKDGGKAHIEWETASEENALQYEIERSDDGQNFELIGIEKIISDTDFFNSYNFQDDNPKNGANYYRLRIIDYDGSFEYSSVGSASFGGEVVITIAPNPVMDVMMIDILEEGMSVEGTVEIFDQSGLQVFQGIVQFENGQYQTNAADLKVTVPGAYFIRVTGKNSSKVIKFMKIN